MRRLSRLTRDQVVNLRAGQNVLVVLASSPHAGIWGDVISAFVPADGGRTFAVDTHRGAIIVGVESIAEIGRHIHQ